MLYSPSFILPLLIYDKLQLKKNLENLNKNYIKVISKYFVKIEHIGRYKRPTRVG